jgi:hypothetical protein
MQFTRNGKDASLPIWEYQAMLLSNYGKTGYFTTKKKNELFFFFVVFCPDQQGRLELCFYSCL